MAFDKAAYDKEYHRKKYDDPEWRGRQLANASSLQRAKIAFIREHKESLGCKRCSEDDPVCLDLHHRDPSTKNALLRNTARRRATSLYQLGWQAIKDELGKCDVLCANCHRKLEAGDSCELLSIGEEL